MTSSANRPTRRKVAGERGRQRSTAPTREEVVLPAGVPTRPAATPASPDTSAATPTTSSDTPVAAASPSTPAPDASPARARVIPPRDAAPVKETDRRPAPGWARPAAWGALALALVALVVSLLLWVEAGRAADRSNGTRAATSAARTAVESMLSYDYKTFDEHTKAVDALLTGSFRAEFDKGTTESVKPLAVQNQAVVQARAGEVGVMSASDNTVRVLAFVNQSTTSAKLDRPQVDQNRVILTMSKVEGRWLVSKVEAF